jgi:hypothetical protein
MDQTKSKMISLMCLLLCLLASTTYGWCGIVTVRTFAAAKLPTALLHVASNPIESTAQLRREDESFPAPILRRRSLLDDHRQSRKTAFTVEVRRGAVERKYRGKRGLAKNRRGYQTTRFVALAFSAIATVALLSLRSAAASSLLPGNLSVLFPAA